MKSRTFAVATALCAAAPAFAAENLDWATIGRIRDEGFRRSQVMETAAQLTDVHGPRLSGSPQYKQAAEWARQQLQTWGLADAHLEPFPFGRGWSFERCSAHVVAPVTFPLVAIPKAWTAGTSGTVRGKVLRVKVESEADVEKWKGKLAGMVVWAGEPRELKSPEGRGVFQRYSEAELDELETYQVPGPRGARGPAGGPPFDREAFLRRRRISQALEKLYAAEKPLAVVEPSARDANVLQLGSGGSRKKGDPQAVTQLVASAAQWSRVARLLDRKLEVEVELDVRATFYEEDTNGYNILAEIPGGDRKSRAGDARAPTSTLARGHRRHRQRRRLGRGDGGGPDPEGDRRQAAPHDPRRAVGRRGAGPARLARLRRGALRLAAAAARARGGRAAGVPAQRAAGADDAEAGAREARGLLQLRQRHRQDPRHLPAGERRGRARSSRLDGGRSGPGRDSVSSMRNTGGTDHQSFDAVGLPGFQFIQDPIEYEGGSFFGTHHTDMDVYDRLQRDDLMQAAVVIATFAYTAANRDEMLPRKPLPPVAAPAAPSSQAPKVKGAPKTPSKAAEATPGAR